MGDVSTLTLRSGATSAVERKASKFELPLLQDERDYIVALGEAFEVEHGIIIGGDAKERPLGRYIRGILRGYIHVPTPSENPLQSTVVEAPPVLAVTLPSPAEWRVFDVQASGMQEQNDLAGILIDRNIRLQDELLRIQSTIDLQVDPCFIQT